MEIILTLAVILFLCFLLNISAETIAAGVLILVGIFVVFMLLFFLYSFFELIESKKHEAEFSRIDKNPKRKFSCAYYKINGKEIPCAFPSEPVFRKKIYPENKIRRVRLDRKENYIYDSYAAATIIIGLLCSAFMTVIGIAFIVVIFC